MAKPGEARLTVAIFQQDRRTYQNLSVKPETTARGLCDRAINQFDLVQLSRRELVKDGRQFGLFLLTAAGGEMLVPDQEAVVDFIKRMGEAKPKFAFLMRDSKDFLFLKEKNVSIDAAIPPTSKAPPAKDAQGWLRKKKEGKQWKKRWVKLVANTLHYQKDPRDREPLGILPLNECSLSFKVLSGLRTIILAKFDKTKPNARPTVFLFCADKESTGLSVDEWYSSIYARITPPGGAGAGATSPTGVVGKSGSIPVALASPSFGSPISTGLASPPPARREGVNERMRERAICCWVNTICARKKMPLGSVGTELDNAIILIAIAELGFKHRVTARYAQDITAMSWEQKINNLTVAFDALRQAGARFSPIAPQVFVDGHKQPLMQFLWEVIISFHMRGGTAGIKDAASEESYKRQLLEKTQYMVGISQDCQVTNFTSSFADGFAFCYIVDKLKPGVVDFRDVTKDKPRENLKAAFSAAATFGMPPVISAYEFGEGVDELAVIIWLCVWLDLMDPARKAFFEPLPVVPVSQRVLMDKLMDGKDNPREIMAVMREISQNEKDRKVYLEQKDKEEAEKRKKEELARMKQEIEAERMANLQSIMSSVANKKKGGDDDDASPELDEEEQFRRQQAIIKMQYEKYEAEQRRLARSTRGSSPGKPASPVPTASAAAAAAPAVAQKQAALSELPEDSLERRMMEEFGSDEEIVDVTAELKNLDAMMGELETAAEASSPAPTRRSEAQREVDDLFAWESGDEPSSASSSARLAAAASAAATAARPAPAAPPPAEHRGTVDRVIDEQIKAIENIRSQERSNAHLSVGSVNSESGSRRTATKAEMESTVNEVEAFLSALTMRRASASTLSGSQRAAVLAARQEAGLSAASPPNQFYATSPQAAPASPYVTVPAYNGGSAPVAVPVAFVPVPASAAPYAVGTTPPFTQPGYAPPYAAAVAYAPAAYAPQPVPAYVPAPYAAPPLAVMSPAAVVAPPPPQQGRAALTNSATPFDDVIAPQRAGLYKQQSFDLATSPQHPAAPAPHPPPVSQPPAPAFTVPSPPRSPPYVPPASPPPVPPFSAQPLSPPRNAPPLPPASPSRDAPLASPRAPPMSPPHVPPPALPPLSPPRTEPPAAPVSPRTAEPPTLPPLSPPRTEPPAAPISPRTVAPTLPPLSPPRVEAPPPPAQPVPAPATSESARMKPSALAALMAFEDSFAAFDMELPKTAPPPAPAAKPAPAPAPAPAPVVAPPVVAATQAPSSSPPGQSAAARRNNDFGDLDAQFAQLTASLNSLASDAAFVTRPKPASTMPSAPPTPAVQAPANRAVSPSLPQRMEKPAAQQSAPISPRNNFASPAQAVPPRANNASPAPAPASPRAVSPSRENKEKEVLSTSPTPHPLVERTVSASLLSLSSNANPNANPNPISPTNATPPSRSFSPSPTPLAASTSSSSVSSQAAKRDSPPKSPRPAGPIVPAATASANSTPPVGSPNAANPWMAKINTAMPGKLNSPFFAKAKADAKPNNEQSPARQGPIVPRSVSPAKSPRSAAEEKKEEPAPARTVKPAAFKAKPAPVVAAPSGGAADLLFGDDSATTNFALKKDDALDKAMADLLN